MKRDEREFHVELVRLEVRCCCDPARVYGTLAIRASRRHRGARVYFDAVEKVPAGGVPAEGTVSPPLRRNLVRLEVDELHDPDRGRPFLALKYDDEDLEPREKLRRLKMLEGFEPSAEALAQWP